MYECRVGECSLCGRRPRSAHTSTLSLAVIPFDERPTRHGVCVQERADMDPCNSNSDPTIQCRLAGARAHGRTGEKTILIRNRIGTKQQQMRNEIGEMEKLRGKCEANTKTGIIMMMICVYVYKNVCSDGITGEREREQWKRGEHRRTDADKTNIIRRIENIGTDSSYWSTIRIRI